MKRMTVLLLAVLFALTFLASATADSGLPLNGESWIHQAISEVASTLQSAGYSKNNETNNDYILFFRNESPENVYLYYDKQTLETNRVDMVFYNGADQVAKIVESYSLIYGEPTITEYKQNELYFWSNGAYSFSISFPTNYEDAKAGNMPFSLTIGSEENENNEQDSDAEATSPEPTSADELIIGQTISLPFVEMTFTKVEVLDELIFSEIETGSLAHSLGKTKPNTKYIAIRGTIMNKSKQSFEVANSLRGKAYVDGYEYDIGVFSISFNIEPLINSPFYMYALVPNELAHSFETCNFRFGFNNEFQTDYSVYDESIQYDYKYQITVK